MQSYINFIVKVKGSRKVSLKINDNSIFLNHSYHLLINKGPLIRCEEYSLPVEIAVHVEGVLNMADLPPVVHSNARRKSTSISEEEVRPQSNSPYGTILPNYVTPGLLHKVYHIDSSQGSPFVSQGVYQTSNEYFSPSDLSAFQQFMAIPIESVAVPIHSFDLFAIGLIIISSSSSLTVGLELTGLLQV